MSDIVRIEIMREIVETWVSNLYPYIIKRRIEKELRLGKDALYKYKFKNRKFPDGEIINIYEFLKERALIKTSHIKNEDEKID